MSWATELGQTALFADVAEPVLDELGDRAVHRTYRKGSVVFVQGEHGNRCFVILSGSVKVTAYHPDGRELVLSVLAPGDVFGELTLFDEAPRSADAITLEDSDLISLDADTVIEAVRTHPELAVSLLRILSRRLRDTNEAFQDASFFDVTGRLAKRLADLADQHGTQEEDGILIDLTLSQEELASMIGATRESVNKALSSLTRRGLVERRGRRYLVHDPGELRDRAR